MFTAKTTPYPRLHHGKSPLATTKQSGHSTSHPNTPHEIKTAATHKLTIHWGSWNARLEPEDSHLAISAAATTQSSPLVGENHFLKHGTALPRSPPPSPPSTLSFHACLKPTLWSSLPCQLSHLAWLIPWSQTLAESMVSYPGA